MNKIFAEKEFQNYFLDVLRENNGYKICDAREYNQGYAINSKELFQFLYKTQPETMEKLNKFYKDKTEETILANINKEEMKKGRLEVLKHGIEIHNLHLDMKYSRPETTFNAELNEKYEQNIYSVAKEVWASAEEKIDAVIFLNGLAIMTFELKCNLSGQSCQDAIKQYKTDRSPNTRLFRWKAGALVMFAMDIEEVYMTTKLDGASTYFLPFNQGNGKGIDAGAGNPICKDKLNVYYMWENILQKDSVMEIIDKFMFIATKVETDKKTGKKIKKETVVFPRYHQLDVIRMLVNSVKESRTSENYLLQHSAGSGKTYEISWLAYRLASLHSNNKNIFDNVIICTDRIVVDRQLQASILERKHKDGFVSVMDENCNSRNLADELSKNTKIIVTTIQKFPYILESVSGLQNKNFAVIIDEAHSSTAGKNMEAVTKALGSAESHQEDIEELLAEELKRNGKQKNVAMFAFTATPKATTLQLFGKKNAEGEYEAHHIYSMKQATEEGFILDVLENYIVYETNCRIRQITGDDPMVNVRQAKQQITKFVDLDETNIAQRTEIIIEHFQRTVMKELGGQAKAMVITSSREAAVKYKQAFDKYIQRKGYNKLRALVAFSGKVTIDDTIYTEQEMNGFPEKNLPNEFDKKEYQILIVADKYQTGFDQKKLCAMYVLKTLKGVAAVQTLSRLNRICPPYNKETFVVDFVNSYDDMKEAFGKYYTSTMLTNSINQDSIYTMMSKINEYNFLNENDIGQFNDVRLSDSKNMKNKFLLIDLLENAYKDIKNYDKTTQREIATIVKRFVTWYEFLIKTDDNCCNTDLYKRYVFLSYLKQFLKREFNNETFNPENIEVADVVQYQCKENTDKQIESTSGINLPLTSRVNFETTRKQRLSEIIKEINEKAGKMYDDDKAVEDIQNVMDTVAKSENIKRCAKINTINDFRNLYFETTDQELINNDDSSFCEFLLENASVKEEIMTFFEEELYHALRNQTQISE